jgi:glutathione peroxidase
MNRLCRKCCLGLVAVMLASAAPSPAAVTHTVSDYSLVDSSGKVVPLSQYKGKVLVVVNLASQSVFADQIAALNKLQQDYGDQGLQVIGVPSNDFGKQEPGDDAAIQKHYHNDLHADFPVMAKSFLTGVQQIPLYAFLTTSSKDDKLKGPVHWNFTKFIVGRDGKVVARFAPDVAPDSPEFLLEIEKVLKNKGDDAKSHNEIASHDQRDRDDDDPES